MLKLRGKNSIGAKLLIGIFIFSIFFALFSVFSGRPSQAISSLSFSNKSWLPFVPNSSQRTTYTQNQAGPIIISPHDGSIWVVNPDSGSVTVLTTDPLAKKVEISVGQEPWSLAVHPNRNEIYLLDRALGKMFVLDGEVQAVTSEIDIGPEPYAMALNSAADLAYVTLATADQLAVVDLSAREVAQRISVSTFPYGLSYSQNGLIYICHRLSFLKEGGEEARDDGRQGQITVLLAEDLSIEKEIVLEPNEQGIPSLLAFISASGNRLWVPHVRAAPDLPAGLTTTVFAAVTAIDMTNLEEAVANYLPLNDQEIFGSPVNNPVSAVPSPDGNRLYVVLAGSDIVEVIDISQPNRPSLIGFLPAGKNPQGMAISSDGRWGYVMSYLSRTVKVLDLEDLSQHAEIVVTAESLSPAVLRGKELFHAANNPRLSNGAWVSCASCHPAGGTDGLTWVFPDGPRQTPPLWNVAETAPFHWSAALDELHDVEDTITGIQHGLGLASGQDPALLGSPNRARSSDLDALAEFMQTGIRPPTNQSLSESQLQPGRDIFVQQGCHTCHGGPNWTISQLTGAPGSLDGDGNGVVDDALHDVGTLNERDIRGEVGFDVPTLLNISQTAPYFHDGSIADLETLIRSGHPQPQLALTLTDREIEALVLFLKHIGTHSEPIKNDR